jgi:hypothetical protein
MTSKLPMKTPAIPSPATAKDVTPPYARPQPGGDDLPAAEDSARPIGRRAAADLKSGRQDTDAEGHERQRRLAPASAPTRLKVGLK